MGTLLSRRDDFFTDESNLSGRKDFSFFRLDDVIIFELAANGTISFPMIWMIVFH